MIFASILIFASSVYVSKLLKNALHMRGVELDAWSKFLRQLQVEISYGLTPLPQALSKCNVKILESFCENVSHDLEVCHDFSKIWLKNLDIANKNWHLLADDLAILRSLAGDLGGTAVADQNRILNLAVEKLQAQCQVAVVEYARIGRLVGCLGYSAGLLLVAMCW